MTVVEWGVAGAVWTLTLDNTMWGSKAEVGEGPGERRMDALTKRLGHRGLGRCQNDSAGSSNLWPATDNMVCAATQSVGSAGLSD